MALSKLPYKGTRDFFPKEKRVQDYIFSHMRHTAELFGYEAYDGPLLEEVELYKAKSGEELINEQIYSFTDRGNRFVAIRPEMTPTVARMVAQIHREEAKPIRWYSIPNLYRYEKPQKGRLREHWQFNCDIFGAPGRAGEAEILQVAISLMKSFGASNQHFEILVNDRMIVDTIFSKLMKQPQDIVYRLYKIVDRAKKVPFEAIQKMVDETGIDAQAQSLFYRYLKLNSFEQILDLLRSEGESETADQFAQFVGQLESQGITSYVVYDPTIVRGLDYYTGIVFEIFDKHPDNRRAICGGGAYANLLKIFNEDPLPGVGFGLGDVTLTDFLVTHKLLPDLSKPNTEVLVTYQDDAAKACAMQLAQSLRDIGVKTVTGLEMIKFKKVFATAEKKGISFVVLIGERELSLNQVEIKNLSSGEQRSFASTDIDSIKGWIKK